MRTPLNGRRIVITRSMGGNRMWAPQLQSFGAIVYQLPTIKTEPIALTAVQEDILHELETFDWLVFTSARSVRYFHSLMALSLLPWPAAHPRVAVIGEHTALAAEKHGLRVTFMPPQASGRNLAETLPDVQGKRVLLPQSAIANPVTSRILMQRQAQVFALPVYATIPIAGIDKTAGNWFRHNQVDAIFFASPSAAQAFCQRIPQDTVDFALTLPAVTVGQTTAERLQKLHFTRILVSRTPSLKGMVTVLQSHLKSSFSEPPDSLV